jgi:hypothetical protein
LGKRGPLPRNHSPEAEAERRYKAEQLKRPEVRARRNAAAKAWYYASPFVTYREEQLARQGGKCDICGAAEPGGLGWHLDHDHTVDPRKIKTADPRSYRGTLCYLCNSGLVTAYERSPDLYGPIMPPVAAYVERWSAMIRARMAAGEAQFAEA